MTLYNNINSTKMKTVGAVVFIRLLLLIAGVEPNPGPSDILVFRYQFLLTEVGTKLLRKLLDDKVSNDLMQYLRTYNHYAKQLKVLIDKDIITDEQKRLLPPQDNNPDTAKFDITLLTCLLRNLCGLKHHLDNVWKHPSNGDMSMEAEITRLKECRNFVVHKGTVHISESEFNLKWKLLCQILHRLNNFCGIPNLTEMIEEVSIKPLDEQLERQHENILKAWHEAESLFEKGIVDIKIGQTDINAAQSELKVGQSKMKVALSELKVEIPQLRQHLEDVGKVQDDNTKRLQNLQHEQENITRRLDNSEQANSLNNRTKAYTNESIKELLKKSYKTDFRSVCVTPLYSEDDRMDMLTVYTPPKMEHVPYHKARKREGNYKVSSYEQVFCNKNSVFRNIFITGDAGMGKTSFGQFMSFLWSKTIGGDIFDNEVIQKDASFMTNFDFVFYISLKETNREDVVKMIIDKYVYTSSNDEFEERIKLIEQILQTKNCLVILDGLDEWRPDIGGHRNLSLPRKVKSDKCTYLTTCRPYRIETVRLSEKDIDHQVQITGFDHEKYIREVFGYINKSQNTNKDPDDFLKQIKDCKMVDQLHIPLIASQLIVVWFNYEMSNMNRAMIYGSIVDMLFARAIKNEIKFPSMASSDVHLPEPFSRFTDFQKYVSTLEKVCLLSFLLLFDPNNETPSLVFTTNQLMSEPYNISSEQIDFLCQLGIISKNKVIASFGEQSQKLSFLHMSYLEFLAALFVSLFDKTGLFPDAVKKIVINKIEKYQIFFILLSGISPQSTSLCFEIIYTLRKDEVDFQYRRKGFDLFFFSGVCDDNLTILSIRRIILSCFKEINVSGSSQKFIKLEDYAFDDDEFDLKDLTSLLVLNKHNVKFLYTLIYLNEFADIKGLQYFLLDDSHIHDRNGSYDDRFNTVMLQNRSTLHSVRISSSVMKSVLPVRSLHFLTSICLDDVILLHDNLHDLMNYISSNILIENCCLYDVTCKEHRKYNEICKLVLNLSGHSKLLKVGLNSINLECSGLNTSSLTSLYVGSVMSIDLERIIEKSQLKYLFLIGNNGLSDDNITNAMKNPLFTKSLTMIELTIPDSVSLLLHPDIVSDEYIDIELYGVRMNEKCFLGFLDNIINRKSMIRVEMSDCEVTNLKPGLNIKDYLERYNETILITDETFYSIEFETIK